MKQYNVTGMSCAACSARVERAVNGVPGEPLGNFIIAHCMGGRSAVASLSRPFSQSEGTAKTAKCEQRR